MYIVHAIRGSVVQCGVCMFTMWHYGKHEKTYDNSPCTSLIRRKTLKSIITFIMRLGNAMQTQRCRSLHIGKSHDQHLEACCCGIRLSSCYRQGTILNSHLVIGIAANTSIVLNCALVTYIMMTADAGLPDAV